MKNTFIAITLIARQVWKQVPTKTAEALEELKAVKVSFSHHKPDAFCKITINKCAVRYGNR